MPFVIRKLPCKNLYSVKNKITGAIHSKGTTLENAKSQVRLLHMKASGSGLAQWSDIKQVQRLADEYDVGEVKPSTHKGKKYMVMSPVGKPIHFGQLGYADFSEHKDEKRRQLFRTRNAKWANSPKWTPAWLSFHLLW